MWTNSKIVVHNYVAALKLQYTAGKGCLLDYNIAYITLVKTGNDDGLEDGFNTPKWIMNFSLTKDRIYERICGGIFVPLAGLLLLEIIPGER